MSQRALFLKHLGQTSDFPVGFKVSSAQGIYLYDTDNQRYIDLISGIAVANLGHQHPNVIEAIHRQVDQYTHVMVYGEYIQSPQVRLAHALADTLPDPLSQVFFVNSGSEAVEGAIKLAKRFTGRSRMVSFEHAYHGATVGALSVGGNEKLKRSFRPLMPGVSVLPFGDEQYFEQINDQVAAVIIEVVQGEAGVRKANKSYFKQLKERCEQVGALLIIDEIQTGFGRTGTLWAFEPYDFVPDILLTAKAMGGGMPLGGFIASVRVMGVLKTNPVLGHITTFGGHPVSAAASLASLKVLQEGPLIRQVPQKEQLFLKLLQHPQIKEVRSSGLMIAVELGTFEKVQQVLKKALELGVLSDWFLFCDTAIRIAPPLIISEDEIEYACKLLLQAIGT